jgi:hypothetical protein
MSERNNNLFRRLTQLFSGGPVVKRKVKKISPKTSASSFDLFRKTQSTVYSAAMSAYGTYDRLARYSDFSEMEYTPELSSALDIYSEECASPDETGSILHIFSDNPKIKEALDELFIDTLNIDFNLTSWVRNLCKYGDFFLFNDVDPDQGVINAFPIPVSEMEREEGYDPDNPLAYRFRWATQGNQVLESWQVSHFRLLGNDAFLPYGSSVLESARRIWRQLILVEDAMLVYRVVRSPDRRVFYIDVGNVPAEDIPNFMEQAQSTLKKSQVVDKTSGRVDLRYNPLSVDEDYFIPVRGGESGTKIDTLSGGTNATAIEDVEYIQKKLFSAIKIPKAYLGYDEGLGSKATLSQEDIRFSRTISRIQRTVLSELNKIAIVHLFCKGFSGDDLADFNLKLSIPSTIAQQQKLEIFRTRFDIISSIPEGTVDKTWIRKNVLKMTDTEIEDIKNGLIEDRLYDLKLESTQLPQEDVPEGEEAADLSGDFGAAASPSPSGGGGGLDALFGGDLGGGGDAPLPPPAEGDAPPPGPENASVSRRGSFLKEKDKIKFNVMDDNTPIRAQSNINRVLKTLNLPPSKPKILSEIDYKNASPEEKKDHLEKKKKKYRQKKSGKTKASGGIDLQAQVKVGKGSRSGETKPFGTKSDLSESEQTEELQNYLDSRFEAWNKDITNKQSFTNNINEMLKNTKIEIDIEEDDDN